MKQVTLAAFNCCITVSDYERRYTDDMIGDNLCTNRLNQGSY